MNKSSISINRALISVFDKTGIIELATILTNNDVEILSTGGTAKHLRQAGITVVDVSDHTGFPEIMDGRVKTINPKIEGGILGLRDTHASAAKMHNIKWIDLVVCNLYPFAETISKPASTLTDALENIDIGGPTMIRSAAKNLEWTSVLVDPSDYQMAIDELTEFNGLSFEFRKKLSAKAFAHCAQYDSIIHNYLINKSLPETFTPTFNKQYNLRYGENPHQRAAAYRMPISTDQNVLDAKILNGKQLSYNNLMDADAALSCIREFTEPTCLIVKHGNPCGVASGDTIADIYSRAFNADSKSAFGGIIALNRTCDFATAEKINSVFIEIVIAPDYEKTALEILTRKKNLRILSVGEILPKVPKIEHRFISGGLLVQETDISSISKKHLNVVTENYPGQTQIGDMLFAWKVLKHVKSNAIITVKNKTSVGIGAGQVSRVDAVEIAITKSADNLSGAILASDAFFPFRDSIDLIAKSGVKAIIQPGGSIRDNDVIAACNEYGIAMAFTGMRCFKH